MLQPSFQHNAPLRISFDEANIWEALGDYEAVSYTWGGPELTFPLYHDDGFCVWVTGNLDLALRRLRHRLDPRRLWADAAYIDQSNLAEKAIQIPQMNRVYRGAKRVLAFLGPGGGEGEQGMRLLSRASQARKGTQIANNESTSRQVGALFSLPWFRRS